jgi:aerobic C4-dicarboxylate transport protein
MRKIFDLFRRQLILQVIFAITCGVIVGELWPSIAVNLNFISIIFINLIKLIISPLIFVSIILGICQHQHVKGLGSLASRTLIYFEVMSVVAIILAFAFMLWLQPGDQFDISAVHQSDISRYINTQDSADLEHGWKNFIINIFPDSILGVLSGHNLIPVIVLAVFISLAVLRMTHKLTLLNGFATINELLFNLINIIVRLSPLAAFGAIAYAIGEHGVKILLPLGGLVLTILLIMITFCLLLTLVAFLYGVNVWKLMLHIREELIIAFGTSSSEAVFPQLMKKLESFGCSKSVVGFVLPTGYSFNLDGTAIYVVAGALFIQQAYGIPFTLSELFLLLGIILVTSKGAAGVTGAGFVTLAATLSAMPGHLIPVEGLALLLGIDRFMSDARTMCNLFGNSVGTVIIAKAQGEFNPVSNT